MAQRQLFAPAKNLVYNLVSLSMDPLIPIVTIKLGARSYPVHIGDHLLDEVGRICRATLLQGRAAIVSDKTVAALYG